MKLDPDCKDYGYLLGRIFAIYERSIYGLSDFANPDDLRRAMETPYCIFPRLFARYHSPRTTHRYREGALRQMLDMLPSDYEFPQRATPYEQGRFAVGYDHELAEIYREQNLRRIAQTIKRKRIEMDLTQEQLAEKTGISRNSIGKVESGDCNVSVDTLSALMAVLGIKMTLE